MNFSLNQTDNLYATFASFPSQMNILSSFYEHYALQQSVLLEMQKNIERNFYYNTLVS